MTHAAGHSCSPDDLDFRRRFEAGEVAPAGFTHRDHIRLAYVYLCEGDADVAHQRMRAALYGFIGRFGIDPAKYHETITCAWVLAVDHFMHDARPAASADAFIAEAPRLLRKEIMSSHYSDDLLFSGQARARWVEPDRVPIPRHG